MTEYTYTAYIHTTPEQLWTGLTSPAFTRYYFDLMVGFMTVDSDWRPGARVVYRTDDGQAQIEGHVLAVEPPHRLVMSLSLRYDPEVQQDRPSRLSWEITPMGEICKLSVVHDDVDGETRTIQDVSICMPSILSNLKILLETGKPRLIKAIVIDCAVPARLASFWAAAMGYVMQGPSPTVDDDFVGIADPQGVEPELGFQRVPEPKLVKNRLHLDLHVVDRAAETDRLVALGAQIVHEFEGWTVMSDPEGNEFCIVAG